MSEIRNRNDWNALEPREKEDYLDALEAVALMRREGLSLDQAANQVGVSEDDVLRWTAGPVVHTDGLGHWMAEPTDRLYRRMRVLTPDGLQVRGVRGSDRSSQIGSYWNAVQDYLRTGDADRLRQFPPSFETDPDAIVEWWRRGELDFLDIYET